MGRLEDAGSNGRQRTAIVVGAGAGGIAAAARLAKEGFKVEVYEKNDYTGGRCSLIKWEGHRFDRGPSLLLLPEQFRSTFADLGTSLEAEDVDLLRCDPNYRLHFHDNVQMELSTSLDTMKREIERFEGKAGFSRYLAFLREAHDHYELSVSHVLSRPFPSLFSLLRPSFLFNAWNLHPLISLYARSSKYFHSERLRRAFTFGSMYMGMSPFQAPSTYSLLQYTELAEGIWYPKGGFHAVIDALVRVGQRLGVTYHLSTPVASVTVDPSTNRATGIQLSSGEQVHADLVVLNADLVTSYSNLLPQTAAVSAYAKTLRQKRTSCSSISFYWALSGSVPALDTHNIFLAEHYAQSFNRIFDDHAIPEDPSFYVNVPSRVDRSAAPAGKDSIVVLVPCGHLPSADDPDTNTPPAELRAKWDQLVDKTRKQILGTIQARTGADLSSLIIYEKVNTPIEWKDDLALDRGAILGLSHDFFNVLGFRPKMKAECGLKGVWFVGASTHPGTGVPIVLAGSRMLVDEVKRVEGDGWGTKLGRDTWVSWARKEWYLGIGKEMDVRINRAKSNAYALSRLDRMEGGGMGSLGRVAVLLMALAILLRVWIL